MRFRVVRWECVRLYFAPVVWRPRVGGATLALRGVPLARTWPVWSIGLPLGGEKTKAAEQFVTLHAQSRVDGVSGAGEVCST